MCVQCLLPEPFFEQFVYRDSPSQTLPVTII